MCRQTLGAVPIRPSNPLIWLYAAVLWLNGCSDGAWNNPYPRAEKLANTLYSSFSERPKHLDPVRSYSSNEYAFIAQIYEPPLQYHFLKRPYRLVPQTTTGLPAVRYLDADVKELRRTPQSSGSRSAIT